MRTVLVAAITLMVALAGCTKETTDEPAGNTTQEVNPDLGVIKGVVTTGNLEPITGASVVLKPTDAEATTDLFGSFRYADLEPGTYQLKITVNGYEDETDTVLVVAGETVRPKIQMDPILPSVPHRETAYFNGFVKAWYGPGDETLKPVKEALDQEECTCEFIVKVLKDTVAVTVDAVWEDSVGGDPAPPQYRWTVRTLTGDYALNGTSPSPLSVTLTADDFGGTFEYNDYSVLAIQILPDEVVPTIDQAFDVWITRWVLDQPPNGWNYPDNGSG